MDGARRGLTMKTVRLLSILFLDLCDFFHLCDCPIEPRNPEP